ncbi:MAG: type III pantothenate kinase [Prevotellaceae bacterium]|jgi:type III pantothenate kinase|nr:type III pantothenate kinase [Prevotellaceae bacterium]
MNLVADMGNSRTKLFVIDDVRILHSAIYNTVSDAENILSLFPQIRNGIYSVSGEEPRELQDFLTHRLDNYIRFTSNVTVPIGNLYESQETLGADRLAAAVGVNRFFPNTNVAIFDFGTAITIDFIDNENNFRGGNISPGLSIRFKALNYFTNKLPLLSATEKIREIGTTTQSAIETGVIQGIIGETMSYITKYSDHKIIFTGGDSFYFAKKIKSPIFVFQNPIVYGLNKILLYSCKTTD